MYTYLTTARIVGALFIVASAAAIVGGLLLLPAVEADYLVEAAAAHGQVVTGALLEVVQTIAVIGIAVMLFPIFKRLNGGLALSYVGARTLEGVFVLVGSLSALLVLTLSQEYGQTGGADIDAVGGYVGCRP
jgi:hypothetical protein